jgi:hypothetical protein
MPDFRFLRCAPFGQQYAALGLSADAKNGEIADDFSARQ